MPPVPSTFSPTLDVKIDWKAYFREFDQVHVGEPVFYGTQKEADVGRGWLLYRDGWRYGRKFPWGPEIPPPDPSEPTPQQPFQVLKKQLLQLQLFYWTRRLYIVEADAKRAEEQIYSLKCLQSERSAPIQLRLTYFDEELKRKVTATEPVDYDILLQRHKILTSDVEDCLKMIKQLKDEEHELSR